MSKRKKEEDIYPILDLTSSIESLLEMLLYRALEN